MIRIRIIFPLGGGVESKKRKGSNYMRVRTGVGDLLLYPICAGDADDGPQRRRRVRRVAELVLLYFRITD